MKCTQTNRTKTKVFNFQFSIFNFLTLLALLLIAPAARATVTVTYELRGNLNDNNTYNEIRRLDNPNLYCRFGVGQFSGTTNTVWYANDTQGVDDDYDITFTPNLNLTGLRNGDSISNCHIATNVLIHTVQNQADCHGGIVGRNANCKIDHCTSAATLTIADGVTNCYQYEAIAGYNSGSMTYNLAIGAVIPAISQRGAICGELSVNSNMEKNYYYNCTVAGVENATNVGCDGADNNDYWESAVSIHLLTLGDNVTTTTPFTFTHNETGYYKHNANVELGCTLNVPTGYSVVYTATTADGTDVTATGTLQAYDVMGRLLLTKEVTNTSFQSPIQHSTTQASTFSA